MRPRIAQSIYVLLVIVGVLLNLMIMIGAVYIYIHYRLFTQL